MKFRHIIPLVVAMLATNIVALAAPPPEIPLDVLFANPLLSQPRISPDGRYIAMLQPANNRMNITVIDRVKGAKARITDMSEENVVSIMWLNDKRIGFRQQKMGQESFGFYAIDADGKNLAVLQQATTLSGDDVENADSRRGFSVIDLLPDEPDYILGDVIRGASGLGDVYKININTEKRRKVMDNLGKTRHWMTDRKGVIRIAISNNEKEEDSEIFYRKDGKSNWVLLATQKSDAPSWSPLGFDGDNETLYVSSNIGRNTSAVYKYDFAKNQVGELVLGDDTYDVGVLIFSRYRNKVIGIGYEGEKMEIHWLDDAAKKLYDSINAILPGTQNDIVSRTRDESLCIIAAHSDRDPGSYYLLDTRKNEMMFLGRSQEQIKPENMAPMTPITYTARDGLVVHGYLTLPVGRAPKNLPLIIHPHGGPFGPRDSWGYNPEVQFYANRGYAVLQVNYRGSGGYGWVFEERGYREWGLKMQDDLTDAVKWAIAQGYADPERIAISGASYGGYAALAGLVYTPELYKVGINYVGVSDIARLGILKNFSNFDKPFQKYIARRWLNPISDSKQVKETSPINYVENIRVPSLHAYGSYDPRVTRDHGVMLKQRLERNDKIFEYIEVENEGHGFTKFENSVKFYGAVDAFLKKYFPADPVRN